MKKHIESIREGALRRIGARLLDMLLVGLIMAGGWATGLLSRSSTELKILYALWLLLAALFAVFVWRAYRRIRSLKDEISLLHCGLGAQFYLLHAEYGAGEHFKDVTDSVQRHVKDGVLNVSSGNHLGGDPCKDVPKILIIDYLENSQWKRSEVPEGHCVKLP